MSEVVVVENYRSEGFSATFPKARLPAARLGLLKTLKFLFSRQPSSTPSPVVDSTLPVADSWLTYHINILSSEPELEMHVRYTVAHIHSQSLINQGIDIPARSKTYVPPPIAATIYHLSGDALFLAYDIVAAASTGSVEDLETLLNRVVERDRLLDEAKKAHRGGVFSKRRAIISGF